MKKIYFIVSIFCVSSILLFGVVNAEEPPEFKWMKNYVGFAFGSNFKITPDNCILLASYNLSKIDTNGVWKKSISGFSNQINYLDKMIFGNYPLYGYQTSDGGYLITGFFQYGSSPYDLIGWVLKYDATGKCKWNYTVYDSEIFGPLTKSQPLECFEESDGDYLVFYEIGSSIYKLSFTTDGDLEDYKVVKKLYYLNERGQEVNSVEQISDDEYIFSGTMPSNVRDVGFLMKVTGSGKVSWEKNYSIDETGDVRRCYASKTSDNGFIACCYVVYDPEGGESYGTLDNWVIKTDSSGIVLWSKKFGENLGDDNKIFLMAVTETHDKGFLFGGSIADMNTLKATGYLIKSDDGGNERWSLNLEDNNISSCYKILKTQDNGYAIGGSLSSNELFLAKLGGTGAIVNNGGNGNGNGIGENDDKDTTPGFELIIVIIAFALVIIHRKRRIII